MQTNHDPENATNNTPGLATSPPSRHPILGLSPVEPWPEPVDGAALLDEIARLLSLFVVLPLWAAETLALWILHTYAFHLRDVTTYIGLESPEKRCGKTTLLTVLSELVNRPVVAANISSPAFFRLIEETQPTLLIDEADTFLRGNDDLRGILNSGYARKTAFVVRVANQPNLEPRPSSQISAPDPLAPPPHHTKRNTQHATHPTHHASRSSLARFSCWCPKAIATIGRLPDTLADRCILFRMERKLPDEQCERLRTLDAVSLKRKCARFVLDHQNAIPSARPDVPEDLNDRAADIWEPLLVLADLAAGRWPDLARQAAVALTAKSQDNSPIGFLLFDIFVTFRYSGHERIFSRTLIEALARRTDRPWLDLAKGRKITELWLSQRLRPYGIRPRNIWIDGHQSKGYVEEDFHGAYKRYVPRSEVESFRAEILAHKGETDSQAPAQPAAPTS
jgi:putative DNA primase/helicase